MNMTTHPKPCARALVVAMGFAASMAASLSVRGANVPVTLSGDQEVPPVTTSAKGQGTLVFGDDKSVSGTVTTTGINGTGAHIHEAASGKNGGVIIPLVKGGDGKWNVPPGAKLTDAQATAYKAGNLYVNVHSDAHKDGEIRGQIKP